MILKNWTETEEQQYMKAIKLASKNYAYSGTIGPASSCPTKGPNLDNLAQALDQFYPENGIIYCSLFTWFWIREACDGVIYQHVMKDDGPLFVYFSPKQDGFYAAKILIDNKIDPFKVKLKKAE